MACSRRETGPRTAYSDAKPGAGIDWPWPFSQVRFALAWSRRARWLGQVTKQDKDTLWHSLFDEPQQWKDCRGAKAFGTGVHGFGRTVVLLLRAFVTFGCQFAMFSPLRSHGGLPWSNSESLSLAVSLPVIADVVAANGAPGHGSWSGRSLVYHLPLALAGTWRVEGEAPGFQAPARRGGVQAAQCSSLGRRSSVFLAEWGARRGGPQWMLVHSTQCHLRETPSVRGYGSTPSSPNGSPPSCRRQVFSPLGFTGFTGMPNRTPLTLRGSSTPL